jgi:cell division protein FtsI (penicillin-binding protein 3)
VPGRRWIVLGLAVALAFAAVGGQLIRLALKGPVTTRLAVAEPMTRGYARPDVVDRKGRLVATDLEAPSLYADPLMIVDVDEASERLGEIFPDLDPGDLRRALADRSKRFVWIKRGLAPAVAQRVHDLGLPGIAFRNELRRAYPQGMLAGHLIGTVNVDNRGMSGIERWIDEAVGVEPVVGSAQSSKAAVALALDLGVQFGLEAELSAAMTRYGASGASGVLLDIESGEMLAAASLPGVDPARPLDGRDSQRIDRLAVGTYELGSIFKVATIAMALDAGLATPDKIYDVRAPLRVGVHTMRDLHPLGRPLTVREIFVHSSNVGAGLLALEAGEKRQRAFLERIGFVEPMALETGAVAPPRLPKRWGEAETITISYGHGLALAPLQFAAGAAALFNGGFVIAPTLRKRLSAPQARGRIIAARTSAAMVDLMRRNVTHPAGTGRAADVPGLDVGGKTGTADIAGIGGYREGAVISSFLAVFPTPQPRYLMLVSLYEPKPTAETKGKVTAGTNAAPTAGRVIARIAPLLDLEPKR